MKALFLSNYYPPASRGGYEEWCQEVALGLAENGHEVTVLTSDYRAPNAPTPGPVAVHRDLHLEMDIESLRNVPQFFFTRKTREKENLSCLETLIQKVEPDAVLIWGMWNVERSVPALAEKLMPGRVAYYMGDYWPTLPSQFQNYWNAPARNPVTGLPKRILTPIARSMMAREGRPDLQLERVLFPSTFMRDEFRRRGICPENTSIVYGAIDTDPYLKHHANSKLNTTVSLLCIGRLTYEKGVHTAIKAVSQLVNAEGFRNLKLTVVGDGDVDYVKSLHGLIESERLESFVSLMPAQPKAALPFLYQQADVFLFTSIWPEPFGRVIVEAMASGLPILGTPVGGAAEILIENQNALLFSPEDAGRLSQQLKRLIETPSLREELGKKGREIAADKFDIRRMTSEIEAYLITLAN